MPEENKDNWIAGFWKRIGALFIDTLIVGIFGYGLGLVFENQFVELAGWGRIVGFVIAITYFGIMNSKITCGQTIGKKLLNIQVVNSESRPIEVVTSFFRYAILGIPFFLNGAQFTTDAITSFWLYPLSFVIIGGFLSIIYLYIFNRVTRQSLHDLIVGTYVVNKGVEKNLPGVVWRPHLIVVGVLFTVAAVTPAITSTMAKSEPFKNLFVVQSEITKNPSVAYASVFDGQSTFTTKGGTSKTTTYINVQAFINKNTVENAELAKELAKIITSTHSEAVEKEVIRVTLSYGYDIGIASKWKNHVYNFNPKEL